VVKTLGDFGFASLGVTPADVSQPDQIMQLGATPNRIDLITSIAAVSFEEAWAGRVPGVIDGIPVMFLGRDSLIRNKEATGRTQDRADAEALRRRPPNE